MSFGPGMLRWKLHQLYWLRVSLHASGYSLLCRPELRPCRGFPDTSLHVMRIGETNNSGTVLGAVLGGAWRRRPPPTQFSSDSLAKAVPLLLAGGAGSLAWWRLRGSELSRSRPARQLREAFRLHTLQAVDHEHYLQETG